jgi:hypothetical protein
VAGSWRGAGRFASAMVGEGGKRKAGGGGGNDSAQRMGGREGEVKGRRRRVGPSNQLLALKF